MVEEEDKIEKLMTMDEFVHRSSDPSQPGGAMDNYFLFCFRVKSIDFLDEIIYLILAPF